MRRGVEVVVTALAWTAAPLVCVVVASRTTVGPVVMRLSPGHGLHLGDVAALAAGAAWAALITITVGSLRRP